MYIRGFENLRYKSLQRVPFCSYLGGYPSSMFYQESYTKLSIRFLIK